MDENDFPARRWLPEHHEWLTRQLADGPGLLCLDWDETCAAGDIGEALIRSLDENGEVWASYTSKLESGDVLEAFVDAAAVLSGMDVVEAAAHCRTCVDEAIRVGDVAVRPEIQDLIRAAEACSWEVWVVSASVQPVVAAFASLYGLASNRVIGMNLAQEQGRYLAYLEGPNSYRQGKVDAIEQFIGRQPDLAIGDAMTDLEMLSFSKKALVIGPSSSELRRIAHSMGWPIQPVFESI